MAPPLLKIDGVDTRSFAHSNRRYTDEYTSVYIRRLRVEFNTSTRFCLTPRPSRDVLKQSCAKSICVLLLFLKLCFGTLRVLRAGLPRQLAIQLSRYFSLDGVMFNNWHPCQLLNASFGKAKTSLLRGTTALHGGTDTRIHHKTTRDSPSF